jgi:hypothetical protein
MNPLSMNPTAQRVCAWTGPVLVFFFFIGFVAIAGFIPPPHPSASAHHIAGWYRHHTTAIRIGVLVEVICVSLFAPWGAVIAIWTRRSETGFPVLSYAQVICLGFVLVDAFFCGMTWGVASFRPDQVAPGTTRMLNDYGWFLYLFTWPPFSVWCLAIALAIIWDKNESPAFPRWVAYYNVWIAILLIPAGGMIFFKHGPLGFNGVLAFWVPTVVFFSWICVMTWCVLQAIAAEERRMRGAEVTSAPPSAVAPLTEPAGASA